MKKSYIHLYVLMIILGILVATWESIWDNTPAETIMAATLLLSILSLIANSYIAIENAIEIRLERRKRLFSDYCARFSNDQSVRKVAEWLLNVSELDSDGKVIIDSKKLRLNNNIGEPTLFEKGRFMDFLIEVNIQIINKQIDKYDARKIFSLYAKLFEYVTNSDNQTIYYKKDLSDLTELL